MTIPRKRKNSEKIDTRNMASYRIQDASTLKELKRLRKWAKDEIAEYEAFIKNINKEIKKQNKLRSKSSAYANNRRLKKFFSKTKRFNH